MKKVFVLLLLCLTLLGCEKPEEPVDDTPVVDTPVIDTQAPETVTPNEVVTPSEVEPEVVTPNEPEVPVQPETPVEPEDTAEQPEKNVIILPEADENTKYITIDFPQDFPEEPYTEPNLVSPEEFDWGEYVPFVRFGTDRYARHCHLYSYAILSDKTSSIDDAVLSYNAINEKYAVNNQITPFGKFGRAEDITAPENKKYFDLITQSRIVYISEDAKRFGRFCLTEASDNTELPHDFSYNKWKAKYELIENSEVIFSDTIENVSRYYLSDNRITKNNLLYLSGNKSNYSCPQNNAELVYSNEDHAVFKDLNELFIYDLNTQQMEYKLELNFESSLEFRSLEQVMEYCYVRQIINGRWLILDFIKRKYTSENFFTDFYSLYLFDLSNGNIEHIENYAFNPLLSPDCKYLIYACYESGEIISDENNLHCMKDGFYIKNLLNGETVFFALGTDDFGEYYPINWTEKDKLTDFLDKQ